MGVVTLLGKAFAVKTPKMEVTPSGLKNRLPPTVVSRLKLVSAQPGQTQWARSLTTWFGPQLASVGQRTLSSNSVRAWTICPVTPKSLSDPLMNLWNTSTLPGCSESLPHKAVGETAAGAVTAIFSNTSLIPGNPATGTPGLAATGAATPILSDTSNKLLSVSIL